MFVDFIIIYIQDLFSDFLKLESMIFEFLKIKGYM
jgi:hypothetical protein